MFFILSTGRSGSTSIARTLNQIPGYAAFHEPEPELVIETSAYRYGKIDENELCQTLLETRPSHVNDKIYCESNQTLSLIVPLLVKTFPEAKYIWLVRNALDFVASAYQKQWYTGHSENHNRYDKCSPVEKMWIDGRIEGDLAGDVPADKWKKMKRFEKICWYWRYVNQLIEHDLEFYAQDKYQLIRLETLDVELTQIAKWMGYDGQILPHTEHVNKAKRTPYDWTTWTKAESLIFEEYCGSLMDRLYPEWRMTVNHWQDIEPRNRIFPLADLKTSLLRFFNIR